VTDCVCDKDGFCKYHAENPEEVKAEVANQTIRELAEGWIRKTPMDSEDPAEAEAAEKFFRYFEDTFIAAETPEEAAAALRTLLQGGGK
jgi:hypothetical protein